MAETALKPCPFCGGYIKLMERTEIIQKVHTKVECMGCRMEFEYEQHFAYSKKAIVAINKPFETVWNGRVNDD